MLILVLGRKSGRELGLARPCQTPDGQASVGCEAAPDLCKKIRAIDVSLVVELWNR